MLPDSLKNIITKGQGAGWRSFGTAPNQKDNLQSNEARLSGFFHE